MMVRWNDEVAGRWVLPNHNWAIEWYCLYVQQTLGFYPGQPCYTIV